MGFVQVEVTHAHTHMHTNTDTCSSRKLAMGLLADAFYSSHHSPERWLVWRANMIYLRTQIMSIIPLYWEGLVLMSLCFTFHLFLHTYIKKLKSSHCFLTPILIGSIKCLQTSGMTQVSGTPSILNWFINWLLKPFYKLSSILLGYACLASGLNISV